jgi:hypothetical protein
VKDGLAEQRLRDAGAEHLGRLDDLIGRVHRALADQQRDLVRSVEDLGGAVEV